MRWLIYATSCALLLVSTACSTVTTSPRFRPYLGKEVTVTLLPADKNQGVSQARAKLLSADDQWIILGQNGGQDLMYPMSRVIHISLMPPIPSNP